jgi:hypothetical protein
VLDASGLGVKQMLFSDVPFPLPSEVRRFQGDPGAIRKETSIILNDSSSPDAERFMFEPIVIDP